MNITVKIIPILAMVAAVGVPLHLSATETEDWKAAYRPTTDDWRQVTQHFRFNNEAEPETLDPQIMRGVNESRLASCLFSGLLGLHPKTLKPVPGLAASWTISDDALTYTFVLRQGAQWSDGVAITAQTVVDSWRRALDPATASKYAYQLFPIAGAEEHYRNRSDFSTVGVNAPDDHTLVVKLHSPCPWFLDLCAFSTLYPVPLHAIAQHGDRWTRPENIVVSGPFTLSEWLPRQRIGMVRNPRYWDADFVKLDRVTAYPFDDLNTALQFYRDGQMEWMPGVPADQVEELQSHADYFAMPYLGVYYYRFNVTKPPLNDARVRRALTLAIDRSVITEHITKAGEVPVSWWCPPIADYQPKGGLEMDRDAARALLAEAGFANGAGFPVLDIVYNTSGRHKAIAENITQQWRQTLGINASARNQEWATYLNSMDTLDFQLIRSAWIGDYMDPNTFYDCFVTNGGNNRTGWSNQEYDHLLRESQTTTDIAARQTLFDRMETILLKEECVIAPIYRYVYQGMLRESVMGFDHNLRDWHPLKYVWLEPIPGN